MKNQNTRLFIQGVLNSYSQIFFSANPVFAILIILVSFFDIFAGLSGICGVMVSNALAMWLGYNNYTVSKGAYGFNSLLVCLGLGIYFEPSLNLFFILMISSVFSVFLCVALQGVLTKYALPYLSIPFLLVLWAMTLASREFHALGISGRSIYTLNNLYTIGGQTLIDVYNWWNALNIPNSLKTYFISLGAVFFQYNMLSGILIAIGLFVASRISFILSLIGFYSAYLFYAWLGAEITVVGYSYIGFNYILTSIALGGFFLIPTKTSYFWVMLLTPLVAILTISLSKVFAIFSLPIYSLPFNIIVILFLYILKLRIRKTNGLQEVIVQNNSPEKNLYTYLNRKERFKYGSFMPLRLPFWGEWKITQGHDGEYTHRDDWRHAWDFEIFDNQDKKHKKQGNLVSDYYCYNKMVLAPADGFIEEVLAGIPDNAIGDMNLKSNWGNTIIIKHTDYLYTKLSHLKPLSIKVKKGEFVRQGQIIANCGNTGRSPVPHLHFQVQATPYVGSKTLDYPLANYIVKKENEKEFKVFERPQKDEIVSNIQTISLLSDAYNMIPGRKFAFVVKENNKEERVSWEVATTPDNQTYIYCKKTNSVAYFYNEGDLFYFTNFEGDRKSLLYYFFLGNFKILKGFYKDLFIKDTLPLHQVWSPKKLIWQDLISPFYIYQKAEYFMNFQKMEGDLKATKIVIKSKVKSSVFSQNLSQILFKTTIDEDGIAKILIKKGKKVIEAVREEN